MTDPTKGREAAEMSKEELEAAEASTSREAASRPASGQATGTDRPSRVKLPAEAARRLSQSSDSTGPRILPGMAMIAIFMLALSMANAFNVLRHAELYRPSARYAILAVCTLLAIGVFGFLRLRRWGWALLLGGTFCYSLGNVVLFFQGKQLAYLLPAAFTLVFFLYLVRDQVRDRVR